MWQDRSLLYAKSLYANNIYRGISNSLFVAMLVAWLCPATSIACMPSVGQTGAGNASRSRFMASKAHQRPFGNEGLKTNPFRAFQRECSKDREDSLLIYLTIGAPTGLV